MNDKTTTNPVGNKEAPDTTPRTSVSPQERDYSRALNRTALFFRFYEVRKQPIPSEFPEQLVTIQRLAEPKRTEELTRLNDRIFAHMIQFLFEAAVAGGASVGELMEPNPKGTAEELLDWMKRKNPSFAIWAEYKTMQFEGGSSRSFEEFARQQLQAASELDREFILLMAQMGELLLWYRDHNRALPKRLFSRAWFLHGIRGIERNHHTRALIYELMEGMQGCASA